MCFGVEHNPPTLVPSGLPPSFTIACSSSSPPGLPVPTLAFDNPPSPRDHSGLFKKGSSLSLLKNCHGPSVVNKIKSKLLLCVKDPHDSAPSPVTLHFVHCVQPLRAILPRGLPHVLSSSVESALHVIFQENLPDCSF